MAIEQQDQSVVAAPPAVPTPQLVGDAFVNQYYHILHQSPELVHRFYQENSELGRPEDGGDMNSANTLQAINEKIMSLDCNYKGEVKTIDAQDSLGGGVVVLVTGFMVNNDGTVKRSFTQTFFLAPQENGYYVKNDIFRYTDSSSPCAEKDMTFDSEESPMPEKGADIHQSWEIVDKEEESNTEEVRNPNPSDNGEGSVVDEELPVNKAVIEVSGGSEVSIESCNLIKSCNPIKLEEIPKKSYASVVKTMKDGAFLMPSHVHNPVKPILVKAERKIIPAQPPSSVPPITVSDSVTTSDGNTQEAESGGFSIYVNNLPNNATPAMLVEEFKRFGPVKNGGVQVRTLKGFVFGFVEFEVSSAVKSAIEASPITIGGQAARVEEKRGPRGNNRGRFPPGRGGGSFRGDGTRVHRNGNGRGYPEVDHTGRTDLGSRSGGRGESGNHGDRVYQRVDNGNTRTNHGGAFGTGTSEMAHRVTVPA